jgi:xylan 1,4-beta-xylosidase
MIMLFSGSIFAQPAPAPKTFCNPMNLSYRFMVDAVDAREAADPVVVLFKNDYYLFASRSGGYWWSNDLHNWTFVVPTGLTIIEDYAPALVVMRDTLFYSGSNDGQVYKSADPKSGMWMSAGTCKLYGDPDLFLDTDGKLFMYYGLSNVNPTGVVELDPYTFGEIGSPVTLFGSQASSHGWERRGDDNLLDEQPWIEGSWMVKANNKYYLHYSAPGTEFKTYADGIYVADSPQGPFQYASYSPFSFKPTGFISGAGHGCTFKDKNGNYWRVVTMTISIKHMFERRLGLFPVSFDADGNIHCNTAFGDYPQYLPGEKDDPDGNNFAGMMLLSNKKFVLASSSLTGHGVNYAVDEDIRTYWSARTGDKGEWMMIDLGKECDVEAIQVNFAEEGTTPTLVRGRTNSISEKYTLEISNDGMNWNTLIDKSDNTQDVPHDYIELAQTTHARYVKLTNVFTPGNGKFAVRDLRVFGNSGKAVFTHINNYSVQRNTSDGRDAVISWPPVANADGYIVKYGIAQDKLYNNYMVYDADSIAIHSLNKNIDYYFSVDAFDSGTDSYLPTGEIKSFKTGNWNDIDTWQRFDGTGWKHPAPNAPVLSDGPITILGGHTITVTAADSADQLTVSSGSTLIINPGITFRVMHGIGTDLVVEGTLKNSGIVERNTSSTISFVDSSIYIHDQDSGSIPSADWRSGSTCRIEGVANKAPSNGNQNFCNVIWNCAKQTGNFDLGWNGNIISGNITIINTGSGRWQMCAPPADSSASVTINGDLIQSGGEFTANGSDNAGNSITINQNGNLIVTGGNISISRGSQGGTGTAIWNVKGDVSLTNATTQNANPVGGKFVFSNAGGMQTLTLEGVTYGSGGFPVEVDSGVSLNIGTSVLRGNGSFNLKPWATLMTANPFGIDSSLTNTGAKTISDNTGFAFNGTIAQVSGSLLPNTIAFLIIDNIAGVTLQHGVVVNEQLELIKGKLSIGNGVLRYGSNGSLKYSGTIAQTTSESEFPSSNGPKNLIINNSAGVILHASRVISGNVDISNRKLTLGNNIILTAASASTQNTSRYIVTNNGALKLSSISSSQKLFPVGTNIAYAPVWIANNGTTDAVTVSVADDAAAANYGGRIKVRWNLIEEISGGGNYTLQFGWASALENPAFKADRANSARIFNLSDTTESGTGNYSTQFITYPYSISRSGFISLGTFAVGKFRGVTGVADDINDIPVECKLRQNYPNPFNPATLVDYTISHSGYITLKVYNLLGQEVATLFEGIRQQGNFEAIFDGSKLASGVYLYRLTSSKFVETKKLILVK